MFAYQLAVFFQLAPLVLRLVVRGMLNSPIKSIPVQSADGRPTTVLEYKEWKSIGCQRLVPCALVVFAD
jgi:hypothetical protein